MKLCHSRVFVVLQHSVGVENGCIIHLFHVGAWLLTLKEKDNEREREWEERREIEWKKRNKRQMMKTGHKSATASRAAESVSCGHSPVCPHADVQIADLYQPRVGSSGALGRGVRSSDGKSPQSKIAECKRRRCGHREWWGFLKTVQRLIIWAD